MKALGATAVGLAGLRAVTGRASADVPVSQTAYLITMTGRTSSGVTFTRPALLVVAPTIDRSGASGTGVNARDVAIRSGSPGSAPQAGSVWFATNTGLYPAVGIPADTTSRTAQIDIASVTQPDSNSIAIRLDGDPGGIARTALLNSFNALSGLTANVYQIYQGGMNLRFSDDASTIEGELLFGGIGYIYPGSAAMEARFSGTVVS